MMPAAASNAPTPPLPAFRNRLRNATFAINQRGVSGTVTLAAGAYGHDGVKGGSSGCTYTFATSGLDTTLTISAGSLILPIESGLIEGGNYVLTNAGTAQARVWQGSGTSGSGSYATASAVSPLAASGLTAATQTNVEFSTGTVLRPQMEPGSVATAFERRPPSVEQVLCFRYYQAFSGMGYANGFGLNNTTQILWQVTLFPMRAAPSGTLTGTVPAQSNAETGASSSSAGVLLAATPNAMFFTQSGFSLSSTAGNYFITGGGSPLFTASAELA